MIETERLFIRPFRISDAEDAFEWRSDAEVNRFMPYPCDESVEALRERIAEWIGEKDKYAIVLKDAEKVIGDITLEFSKKDSAYEIGYNLNRSFWRKGYATEAVRGLIGWASEELGAHDFTAFYAKENAASGRVLEKCGFVKEYTGQYSRDNGKIVFEALFVRLHIE
ncbi:MAG: GNAT family N-acetyltransferase [Ruminococcus sp.]|uniref:GNAT family N-acetyltransferase n=1 Tax=Ruminococcus sp. TaxID=41978 RepID=UPI0025E6DEA6|nr:GNAT family N-acetyltransferase [Ruminococcus sp.]MCR5601454.1 GNAT family N-acetyltransferase [Ruminococcus sp.]